MKTVVDDAHESLGRYTNLGLSLHFRDTRTAFICEDIFKTAMKSTSSGQHSIVCNLCAILLVPQALRVSRYKRLGAEFYRGHELCGGLGREDPRLSLHPGLKYARWRHVFDCMPH